MNIKTIAWKNNKIKLIDQTKLPNKLEYVYIKDLRVLVRAIKTMQIRGAPALGAAAALGVYLGVKNSKAKDLNKFKQEFKKVAQYIGSARPTARNLFAALERMQNIVNGAPKPGVPFGAESRPAFIRGLKAAVLWRRDKNNSFLAIKSLLFKEARAIIEEDRGSSRKIGRYGSALLKNRDTVLTICNAGILATIDYGTALGVIYRACEEGKKIKVLACETRPMLQGARLTTWELKQKGIEVTLICDSMAAGLMRQGKVDKVIAGADRIAANGDTANKVGTYNLAVLAQYHKIPFYIAAPASTFDLRLKNGSGIPIEQRDHNEVTKLFFKKPIAAQGIKVLNPAFDLTPHNLITAIITDQGIIRAPYTKNIAKILAK